MLGPGPLPYSIESLSETELADRGSCGAGPGCTAALGGVDVLVNNTAVAVRAPTVDLDPGTADRLLALTVRAPLLLVVTPHPRHHR